MASVFLSLKRTALIAGRNGVHIYRDDDTEFLSWKDFLGKVEQISDSLNGLTTSIFGERLSSICYYGNNSFHFLLYMFVASLVGAAFVPINTRWSPAEVTHAVEDSDCQVMVIDCRCITNLSNVTILQNIQDKPKIIIVEIRTGEASTHWKADSTILYEHNQLLEIERRVSQHFPEAIDQQLPTNSDVQAIIYTSGTTGVSKGVMITHLNQVCQAQEKIAVCHYDQDTRYLNVAPMFHIGGMNAAVAVTMAGGSHVFMDRFTASKALNIIQKMEVNTLVLVPTMLEDLIWLALSTGICLAGIKSILVGGQAMSFDLLDRARAACPHARIIQTYACTETCSTISFADLTKAGGLITTGEIDAFGSLAGFPASHSELKVVNRSKQAVPPKVVGNVWVRGPHVMKGYWKQSTLTSQVLSKGGWLDTGDLGFLDEAGKLYIAGRSNDLIKTGGEKVHASEVESIIAKNPIVKEVAVVGIPDRRFGEAVTAFVVIGSNASQFEKNNIIESIQLHCKRTTSHFKCPKKVFIVPSLPRNSSGKILKHKLIQQRFASSL